MRCKHLLILLLFFTNCTSKDKIDVIVYPDYCGGCVTRNFYEISQSKDIEKFNIYFDSTDRFIFNESKSFGLNFIHIDNNDIPLKFGDYANLVVINLQGDVFELKTNETIYKGKHY